MKKQEVEEVCANADLEIKPLGDDALVAIKSDHVCFMCSLKNNTVTALHVYVRNKARRFKSNVLGLHQAVEYTLSGGA